MADVFGGKPIGIFVKIDELKDQEDSLKTWKKLEKHELRLRMSMAPRNYFEKMAYWTEEGKIWRFPIDNEQGNHCGWMNGDNLLHNSTNRNLVPKLISEVSSTENT